MSSGTAQLAARTVITFTIDDFAKVDDRKEELDSRLRTIALRTGDEQLRGLIGDAIRVSGELGMALRAGTIGEEAV